MMGTSDRREGSTSVRRKRLTGIVASAGKMTQTISVTVERFPWHQKVRKQVRRTRSLLVHDPKNQAVVGDRVVIEETRPLSKRKHFRVVEIIARAGPRSASSSSREATGLQGPPELRDTSHGKGGASEGETEAVSHPKI